jgi:hypothetical protein
MTFKTMTVAIALTLVPTLSMAGGCQGGKEARISCAVGTTYDANTGTCINANT